jgi:hypothetical protein
MIVKISYKQQKMRLHFLLALIFLVASTNNISCQRQQSLADKEFTRVFADISMNKELELQDPPPAGDFQVLIPNEKYLTLINNSQNPVEISTDIRLFYFSENASWLEMTNLVFYKEKTFTLGPAGDKLIPNISSIPVLPDLRETENIKEIRVVVLGEIDQGENQPKEQVGAFFDIPINE